MLTVINKQNQVINVPYESISIDAVSGDPLGKAKFQVIDTNSLIPLSVLQEVIFWDESLQLQRITSTTYGTLPANWSDGFGTNTSSSYTSTFNPTPPGTATTWTYGSGILTASGGTYSLYLLNSWSAQNETITCTMTTSDYGGVAFNVVDTQDYYELAVRDASSPNPNALQLFKTVAGSRSTLGASATIAFTRATSHTISVQVVSTSSSNTITVKFDGVTKITQVDSSSPLGAGQVGLRNDTASAHSSAIFDAFTATSNDAVPITYTTTTDTTVPTCNFLGNNNFNFGSSGYITSGTLSAQLVFPANAYGNIFTTLTFSNNAIGSVTSYQSILPQYVIVGLQYCFSMSLNITTAFTNASFFIKITFTDSGGTILGSNTATFTTTTGGAQRVSVLSTAPAGTAQVRATFGGTTTSTTNTGAAAFTGLQLEPVWFPTLYSYPTPICDFLQIDSITLPDGTASRLSRIFTGFITHLTATYEGTTRIWDVECSAADLLLETSALVNASYTNVSDVSIIRGIVNSLPSSPLFAADLSFQTNALPALAFRNTPICVPGAIIAELQFSDATVREVINALCDITGFIYGVDAYYNVFYYPPFYNQAPYGFSSTPDNITTFPYYDYSIEYDGTQLHNAVRVIGTTFPTTVTESWHFQDGSHTETVQTGKTVNVYLNNLPNAVPSLTVAGSGLSCGSDNGTGYGGASSLISSSVFGSPKLLSFPSPGYASGVAISVTYAYDTLAYVQVQAPDSVAQFGRALYGKINDTNIGSIASAITRGEAELEFYAQPRITIKFKTQKLLLVGQVIVFTSAPDSITNAHYTVNRVNATYLGNGINQYEIEAGTYVDDFIDFFRNTQKAVNRVDHDPALPIQQINNLQQDSLSISDSLNIHL